jgi:multiple sugar transport system permease protein
VVNSDAAPARGAASSRPAFRWRSLATQRTLLAYVLVAPVVLWRLLTSIYPFLSTAYMSLHDVSPVRRAFDFIGAENYVAVVNDTNVQQSIGFTIFFTVGSVALQIVLGLGVAELLNRTFPLRSLVRAINLLPWALSAIVAGFAARWIFNTDYGLINDIVWRLTGQRPIWLSDVFSARMAVVMVDVWKNTAFLTVIFLAGLQGISPELHEAARIDGADGPRAYWYITLPLLTPLILSMAIFTSIYRVLSFEIVYALTEGGPGVATSLMSYLVYLQAFRVLNFGYASALSMTLFGMVLVVGLVGFVLLRRAWARV